MAYSCHTIVEYSGCNDVGNHAALWGFRRIYRSEFALGFVVSAFTVERYEEVKPGTAFVRNIASGWSGYYNDP
jgi:hypothetical protein